MAKVVLDERECEPAALPGVCMKCGRPAEVSPAKRFSWHPPWVIGLIVAGLLVYVIVALALTKRRRVWTPFCPDHAGYWLFRTWFYVGGALAVIGSLIGLAVVAAGMPDPWPGWVMPSFVGLFGAFLVWLIAAAIRRSSR